MSRIRNLLMSMIGGTIIIIYMYGLPNESKKILICF